MRGLVRLPTGGLKGLGGPGGIIKDKRAVGTRPMLTDVISDLAMDIIGDRSAHVDDLMASAVLQMEPRTHLEQHAEYFLYAPRFMVQAAALWGIPLSVCSM